MRHVHKLITFASLAVLALGACGGGAAASPSSAASPPAQASSPAAASSASPAASGKTSPSSAASAAAPAASSARTSTAPAASSKPSSSSAASAAAGAPIKIGVILPATGALSLNGKDNQETMNMYLDSVHGQMAGHKIDLLYADGAADASVALVKAKQLVDNDKVSLLMGLQSSAVCYGLANYIKQAQIPSIAMADCAAQDLTTNPKIASPYLVRPTGTILQATDPSADWVYKAGFRKAIVMTSDFVAGLQYEDLFNSAFVARGGSIVQEINPPLGTNDFGPYLTQLNQSADVLVLFVGGTDGLRLAQQYPNYVGQRKLQIFDLSSQTSNGPKRNQLGTAAVGLVASSAYMEAFQDPANQAFLKIWYAKHPNQPPSQENVFGWAGMQFLQGALEKVNGDVSNKQKLLDALYSTQVDTPRGPIKLDEHHDAIANTFVYQLEKSGTGLSEKPLQTYTAITQFWDRTPAQLAAFPLGKMKGKWVGMTKAKLGDVITPPKS